MAENSKPKKLTEVHHPPALQLPPSEATPLRTPHHHRSSGSSAAAQGVSTTHHRFRKVGWAKKMGVSLKNPLQPGVPLTPQEVRAIVGLDALTASSTSTTAIPPPLTMAQCHVTTNAKTRFLVLLEHRLQYGSTSTYEAYKHGGCGAAAKEVLGELFLTGEAWVRPVEANSLLVCGDPVMMKKTGKLYLLTFRTMDERIDWEMAFQFFLCRAVPTERLERLLLSGWISVFPALGNRVDRVLARRMSITVRRPPPQQEGTHRLLPPKRDGGVLTQSSGSSSGIQAPKEHASPSPPRGGTPHHEEEDEDTVFGEVVSGSEGEDEDEEEEEEAGNDDAAETPLQRKKSVMSEAFSSFMYSKRHRHVVDLKGDDSDDEQTRRAGRRGSLGGRSSNDPDDGGVLASCSALAKFSLDEVNANGLHFVLRCQRPTIVVAGALRRPQPTYLSIQWQRASYTVHAVPTLRETSMVERAARFALRSFAEGGPTQASPPRIVLVENPTWQLYTRPVAGAPPAGGGVASDGAAAGAGSGGTQWTASDVRETELVLRPVFPVTTQPSPVVVSSTTDVATSPVSPRQSRGLDPTTSTAFSTEPPKAARAFRAIAWEGTRCGPPAAASAAVSGLASYSFLVQASHPAQQQQQQQQQQPLSRGKGSVTSGGDAVAAAGQIVALSSGGKVFMIQEDHPDAMADDTIGADTGLDETTTASPRLAEAVLQSTFVPLEIVPAVSDAEQTYLMNHQTPAMRERALYRAANKTLSLNFLQQGLMEPIRIALVGASGSGKSTVAQWIRRHSLQGHRREDGSGGLAAAAPAAGAVGGTDDASALLGDLAKSIHSINCNGIAVPVVVTDIPSSANGSLIRTQCSAADIVVCVFDASDEHSLQWLEANLKAICSGASATTTGGGGDPQPQDAGRRLPNVRYVLCGTRVDSLRVAVDSYRLEAFRNATIPFTGHTQASWRRSIVSDDPTNTSQHINLAASFASATVSDASSGGGGGPSVPPFAFFASVWRHWRLATATRVTANPTSKTMQAMMAMQNKSLSESFLFSPNLRRIAATGAALPDDNHSGGAAESDPLASTNSYRHRDEALATDDLDGEHSQDASDGAASFIADDDDADDDDWHVPKSLMTQLGSVLEEIYLCRLGKCLGWSNGMVTRFALATCEAAAALQDEDAVFGAGHKRKQHAAAAHDAGPQPLPMQHPDRPQEQKGPSMDPHTIGATPARCGVTRLLSTLKLPPSFFFDAVREIQHLPRGGTAATNHLANTPQTQHPSHPPTSAMTPQAQRLSSFTSRFLNASSTFLRGGGGAGLGGATPASYVLMNSSIAAIGPMTTSPGGGGDDGLAVSPSWVAAAMGSGGSAHHGVGGSTLRTPMHGTDDDAIANNPTAATPLVVPPTPPTTSARRRTVMFPDSPGGPHHGPPPPLSPQSTFLMDSTSSATGFTTATTKSRSGRLSLAGVHPTWKDVVSCGVRQWDVHWLVFRWICTGMAYGDPRTEIIMAGLRGEVCTTLPPSSPSTAAVASRGGSSRVQQQRRVSMGYLGIVEDMPSTLAAVDSDGNSSTGGGTGNGSSSLDDRRSNTGSSGSDIGAAAAASRQRRDGYTDAYRVDVEGNGGGAATGTNSASFLRREDRRENYLVAKSGGGGDATDGRVFHPLDLMYVAQGFRLPNATPPMYIPHATIWVCQQPHCVWGDAKGAGGSLLPMTAGPRHVSPQHLEVLFALVGIEITREHAGLLLRWADTNQDRLTDAADFVRWFVDLATLEVSRSSKANGRFGASTTAPFFPGHFLAMIAADWALRVLRTVPHLECVAVALRSGLTGDRAWAVAAHASSLHLTANEFTSLLAAWKQHQASQQQLSMIGGDGGTEWDTADDGLMETVSPRGGGSHTSGSASGSKKSSSILGKIAAVLRLQPGGPGSPKDDSAACHRCRTVFRAFIRPATVCQECQHRFCERCCKSIVVLNEQNKTEKRKLCVTCRRSHSTFMDDMDVGAQDDASSSSPMENASAQWRRGAASQPSSTGPLRSMHRSASSNNTLDALGGGAAPSGGDRTTGLGPSSPSAAVVLWEDNAQSSCSICAAAFTVLRRRHHCRSCGALVCASCSPFASTVRGFSVPQRICTSCRHTHETMRADHSSSHGALRPSSAHDGREAALHIDGFVGNHRGEGVGRSPQPETAHPAATTGDGGAARSRGNSTDVLSVKAGRRLSGSQGGAHGHHRAGSVPVRSADASPAELEHRRNCKRQKWKEVLKDGKDMQFELPWYETHNPHDEYELLTAARLALEDQLKTIAFLRGKPGGKAAIEAERGPLWAYAVYQPGYTAHDAALETAYDAATLDALGPDVGPH